MAQVPELYGILLILVKVKLFIVNLCMFDIRKAFDTNIIAVECCYWKTDIFVVMNITNKYAIDKVDLNISLSTHEMRCGYVFIILGKNKNKVHIVQKKI